MMRTASSTKKICQEAKKIYSSSKICTGRSSNSFEHNLPRQFLRRKTKCRDNSLGSDDGAALNPQLGIFCKRPPMPEHSSVKCQDNANIVCESQLWQKVNQDGRYLLTEAAACKVSAPSFSPLFGIACGSKTIVHSLVDCGGLVVCLISSTFHM